MSFGFVKIGDKMMVNDMILPTKRRNIEEIFRKYSIEILQYCKNIYKVVRKVSEILQEPRNVCSKHYKWNVAPILIFHCNIAVM